MVKIIVSDKDLKKLVRKNKIKIIPFDTELLTPSGIDIRLGYLVRVFKDSNLSLLNPFEDYEGLTTELKNINERFIIQPEEIVLFNSLEKISLPDNIVARLIPRNSFIKIGLMLLSAGGTIEPGFEGCLTLTIQNVSKVPIILYPGMSFCKLVFEKLSSGAEEPYPKKRKAKYQGQKEPKLVRLDQEKLVR